MENTFNHKYKKFYSQGYAFGQNPVFIDFEDLTNMAPRYNNEAFLTGFNLGRKAYERLNGKVCDGIPEKLLTEKLLEEFRINGQIGLPLETDGFTSYQTSFIRDSYEKGARRYEPNRDISLYCLLAINGIDL